MGIELELTGYRRFRGTVIGTVRVVDGASLLFADSVTLSTAKARSEFIAAVATRANGHMPDRMALERDLLVLLDRAEQALNADATPSRPGLNDDDEERVEDYVKAASGFVHVKQQMTAFGPVENRILLANFIAQITEDLRLDDGAEVRRCFVIEGQSHGRPLPPVRIAAESFAGMSWPVERWGAEIRILPGLGRKDLVRDAIQACSTGAAFRTIYEHTGWRRVDGTLLYLHAGGSIGATGAVDGIEVTLEGKLALYRLPPPLSDAAKLCAAVRASWNLWNVLQPAAAAPLLGAAYLAPLAEALEPDFMIWTRGLTGRLKTTCVALVLAHFGPFTARTMPANFEATANSLERQAFLIKDAVFAVDDFRPPADRSEAGEMRRKAARLIRAAGNRSGRGRMRADTSLRPEYWPRGVIVATAEESPPGESTAARTWDVEFTAETVHLAELTAAQQQTGLLQDAMAGFIQWLAGRLDGGDVWLRELADQARQSAQGLGGHLRHAQTFADLYVAWCVFAEYAQGIGAVTGEEAVGRLREVRAALLGVAEQQATVAQSARPDIVFVETLSDLLAGGKAHLASLAGGSPFDWQRWGWVASDDGPRPLGEKLGWVDPSYLFLIPSLAHRLVAKTLAEQGATFPVSQVALHAALERGGFLVPGNKGRRHNQVADGRPQNTIRLDRRTLDAAWSASA